MRDGDEGLTPDQQVANTVLVLANQDSSPTQRLTGWQLDRLGRLARLLHLHKLGLEAELAGRWRRADYFWTSVQEELAALADEADLWQEVVETFANRPRVMVLNDPQELRQRLVNEVFLDLHCAFYNGYLQAEPELTWAHRAFVHVDYVLGLLEVAPMPGDDLQTVLVPALETWIELCEKAQQWDRARELCSTLLGHLPDVVEYQDWLARLDLASTLARVKQAKSSRASIKNAAVLQKGIERLDQMRRDYPYSLAVFEALSHLYHQRAISLANGKQLSEAILSAQKAVAYNPTLKQARETRDHLMQLMLQLQAQMKQVQANLAQRPRARLTAEGSRLLAEAERGFGPAKSFMERDAVKTTKAFYAAQGRRLWRDLGLPESSKRWDERSRTLLVAMSQILSEAPGSPDEVASAWKRIAAENEDLDDLDAAPICDYLTRRIFEDEQMPVQKPPGPVAMTAQQPPVMTGISPKRRWDAEPLALWLFSVKDMRIKVQAVAAVILVLLVGWLAIHDVSVRMARNAAYTRIVEAARDQEALGIIEGVEAYFGNQPLFGSDGRDEQVRALYTEAFVRWFAELSGEPDPDSETHIARYQAFISDAHRQGGD
jgi:hypothetical protein